jgi:hypothetical protein
VGACSRCGPPAQLVDDPGLGAAIPRGEPLDGALREPGHGVIALHGPWGCGQRPRPQARLHAAGDPAGSLVHPIMPRRALPPYPRRQPCALLVAYLKGPGRGGVLVPRKHPG